MTEEVRDAMYDFKEVAITNENIQPILTNTVFYFWPNNMSRPSLCYFDEKAGPVKTNYIKDASLGLEKKIEDEIINMSMSNESPNLSMTYKPIKGTDDMLISYSFMVKNNKARGRYTTFSVISKAKKKGLDTDLVEKDLCKFSLEMEKIFENYFENNGVIRGDINNG